MAEAQTAPVKYIFLDVVSFTRNRSVEAQSDIVEKLNEIVREAVAELGVKQESLIFLPTGDGMCICILNVDSPYDIHMLVALGILRRVQEWNDSTKDSMRQFQIRIGVNANTDNVVVDINGSRNLAGAGINMAQRVMSASDDNQIFVGSVVYETLQQREKYINKFRGYQAAIKHDVQLQVYQFIEGAHAGLNIDIPAQFRPRKPLPKPEERLSTYEAYYLAHAIRWQDSMSKSTTDSSATDTWAVVLWLLADDSARAKNKNPLEKFLPSLWKAGNVTMLETFDHYAATDWVINDRVRKDIEAELSNLTDCFQDITFFDVHFVSDVGKKRLRSDHPDIWREFEFEKKA